jgi:hypothetical protein
MTKMIN